MKFLIFSSNPIPLSDHVRQYMITTMTDNNLSQFPILMEEKSDILSCRAKGVPQHVKKREISLQYFENIVKNNQASRKVTVHSMRRRNFKISIIKSSRSLLSNFTSKRLYCDHYRRKPTFFSFPLHMKTLKLVT